MGQKTENFAELLQLEKDQTTIKEKFGQHGLISSKINYKGSLSKKQLQLIVGFAENRNQNVTIKRSGAGLVINFKTNI